MQPEKPGISTGLPSTIFEKYLRGIKMNKRKRHPLWAIWHGMMQRCTNSNRSDYKYYGQRGISVCARWKTLRNFIDDMGPRPTLKHSIDRVDNEGNYEPDNCRWATKTEQSNNSRSALQITARGKTQTLSAWARELGMSLSGLHRRGHTHNSIEKPVRGQG